MIRYIITFIEVVKVKSMAAAALHLNITAAAVSKHIQALEKCLGVPLFKRSTRHLALTVEGAIYYEHAKKIVASFDEAESALSLTKEEPSGVLKILCGSQFIDEHLLPHLDAFLKKYPKLSLDITLSQSLESIKPEEFDVIVGFTRGIPTNCIQRMILKTRWVLCASPEYLMRHGTPLKPKDLVHHRLITHSNRTPRDLITFNNGESIHCPPIICYNDTRAMRKSVLDGIGLALLHDTIVASDLKEGRLLEVLSEYLEPKQTISIYIAYLQSDPIHLKVRKFVDFIVGIV